MANISKRPSGNYRVQVRKDGAYQSKTFSSLQEAEAWARKAETFLEYDLLPKRHKIALSEAMERYRSDITPTKKGSDVEAYRIGKWLRSPLSRRSMSDINSADIAQWRDRQIKAGIAPSTIKNALTIISQVYRIAATEWGMNGLINPVIGLRMPQNRPARDRRLLPGEEQALIAVSPSWLSTAILWAIETGMRRGEQLGLRRRDIRGRIAHLGQTKNGKIRDVPLSSKAMSLLSDLPNDGRLFPVSVHKLRDNWINACDDAEIQGLHWQAMSRSVLKSSERRND